MHGVRGKKGIGIEVKKQSEEKVIDEVEALETEGSCTCTFTPFFTLRLRRSPLPLSVPSLGVRIWVWVKKGVDHRVLPKVV